MMIPNELVIITNFQTMTELNLRNTFLGLILPSVTSIFYIYLLRESFAQIPDSLYYAAKIDGASDWKYLWKIMVPMCRPTVVTITILKVIECWNSYIWPSLVTDDPKYFLVSNGIQQIRESGFGRANIPAMMAAVVVISIPLIVLFWCIETRSCPASSKEEPKDEAPSKTAAPAALRGRSGHESAAFRLPWRQSEKRLCDSRSARRKPSD